MTHKHTNFYRACRALAVAGVILTASVNGLSRPVQAAPSAGSVQFGSVDVQKILTGYTKKATLDSQISAISQEFNGRFKQQVNSAMLNKEEQTRLGTLLAKPNPTDAERSQVTVLQAKSTRDSQDLASLQQKKDLTDTDKTRLNTLIQQQQAGQDALAEVKDGYEQQLKARADQLSAQLSENVKTTIRTIAERHGLSVVFDSQVAIYTANDITEEVLKTLNK